LRPFAYIPHFSGAGNSFPACHAAGQNLQDSWELALLRAGEIQLRLMIHDKLYWQAEIDSLRAELTNAGLNDAVLDTAVHFLANIGDSPIADISSIIGIYACLGFASGQLGDGERLNRFVMQYV
jgi:hypothetical protein